MGPYGELARDLAYRLFAVCEKARRAEGGAADEYDDAAEFFRRTFLTKGLRTLLEGAIRRLTGGGGDPVVELQTNFGGGKTHLMLALYHPFVE